MSHAARNCGATTGGLRRHLFKIRERKVRSAFCMWSRKRKQPESLIAPPAWLS